jgi:hypothetical protein
MVRDPRHHPVRQDLNKVSTKARLRGCEVGGDAMSEVIRGSAAVFADWWACQSFSASIKAPSAELSRSTALQSSQRRTSTCPSVLGTIDP